MSPPFVVKMISAQPVLIVTFSSVSGTSSSSAARIKDSFSLKIDSVEEAAFSFVLPEFAELSSPFVLPGTSSGIYFSL